MILPTTKVRQLPSFPDLFLLPRSFDSESRTTLDHERSAIHAVMSDVSIAKEIEEHVNAYPHVFCERNDREILIRTREAKSDTVLVHWPDGRGYGAVVFEGGFFNWLSESGTLEFLNAGRHVNVLQAEQKDTMLEPLQRFYDQSDLLA